MISDYYLYEYKGTVWLAPDHYGTTGKYKTTKSKKLHCFIFAIGTPDN